MQHKIYRFNHLKVYIQCSSGLFYFFLSGKFVSGTPTALLGYQASDWPNSSLARVICPKAWHCPQPS